jgi:AcrR family transcriptional regulator
VAAALRLVDAEGLSKLTMRGLAARTGSYHANLYRRVASIEALYHHITARIFGEAGAPPRPEADAREELADYAVRLRDAWSAHPNAVSLLYYNQHPSVRDALDRISAAVLALSAAEPEATLEGLYAYLVVVEGAISASLAPASASQSRVEGRYHGGGPHLERIGSMIASFSKRKQTVDLNDRFFRTAIARALDVAARGAPR